MFLFLKPTISFIKKAFLVVAVYFIVISLFSFFINKDKAHLHSKVNPIEKNRQEIYKIINDKKLNSTKEGKLTITLYKIAMCSMIGEACTDNPKDGDKNYEKSVFGFINKLIVFPYVNPPASGVYWAYSGLQSAGFIPKSYAAEGIGFAAIKPFSNLWKIFRDLSYMLLVLILIAIGFMVMFRMKMNPQTVISVENALPKIIISLILITFSFAIAGFLIDLMYIAIGLIVSILSVNPNNPNNPYYYDATTFKNDYMMATATDLLRDIRARFETRSVGAALGSAFLNILPGEITWIMSTIGGFLTVVINNWLISFFADKYGQLIGLENIQAQFVAGLGIGKLLSSLIKIDLFFIIAYIFFIFGFIFFIPVVFLIFIGASILFLFIRIISLLFFSYLKLIINIIISPFLLLFEAVPGKSAFKYWIMNIIGNLIVYPIIIFVFIISYLIVFKSGQADMTIRLPYTYGFDSDAFRLLIGLGLIFLIPDFVKTTKEILGIKELPFNIGIGTYFGGVATAGGGAIGLLGQIGTINMGLTALFPRWQEKTKNFLDTLKIGRNPPGGQDVTA